MPWPRGVADRSPRPPGRRRTRPPLHTAPTAPRPRRGRPPPPRRSRARPGPHRPIRAGRPPPTEASPARRHGPTRTPGRGGAGSCGARAWTPPAGRGGPRPRRAGCPLAPAWSGARRWSAPFPDDHHRGWPRPGPPSALRPPPPTARRRRRPGAAARRSARSCHRRPRAVVAAGWDRQARSCTITTSRAPPRPTGGAARDTLCTTSKPGARRRGQPEAPGAGEQARRQPGGQDGATGARERVGPAALA